MAEITGNICVIVLYSGKGDHPGLCKATQEIWLFVIIWSRFKKKKIRYRPKNPFFILYIKCWERTLLSAINLNSFFSVYSAKTSFISHLEPVSFAGECEDGLEKTLSRHNIVNRGYGRISC